MPAAAPIKNNFNSGELSPLMLGRVDFERYATGLRICKNQIPLLQGPVTRRPGTYTCDEVKDSTKATRAVRFKYSTISAFVLEVGDQYIRFKKNRAPVYDLTLVITGITQAAVGVVTYTTITGTDPANGDHVDVSGVVGMTQVNGRRFKVSNVNAGANTFELQTVTGVNVATSSFTAYSSAGTAKRVYTLTTTYLEADLFQLQFTQSADVVWIRHPDYPERQLSRVTDSAWNLLNTVFLDGPYIKENTTTTTLTPSAATGDGITITAGPLGAITNAVDNGAGLIRITDAAHGYSDGIYLRITGVTGTTEANGNWFITKIDANTYDLVGSAFVNAYVANGATRPAVFTLVTDIGRYVRLKQGAVWGYAIITAVTDASTAVADVINTLTSTAAKLVWRLGLYSATTGYPACGTFYGDRLYRGGAPANPERLDGSKVGDYDNMAPSDIDGTVTDASAVSFRLNSNDAQSIRWMEGMANGIAVGTFEGEWLVNPTTLNEAITPTNINARQSSNWGSADVQPVAAGSSVLFVEVGGRRVREMTYLYYENVLQAVDATVLAEHITKGGYDPADPLAGTATNALSGLIELAYQRKRVPILWGVRRDGVLAAMIWSKDDKVIGWTRQVVGGWSDAGHTVPALVESACVIPASDGSYDELWLVVKRYINGRVVRMNEFLTDLWEQGSPQEDAYFVDGGLTYDGASATTITGLFHLAGETVQVLVDGATHPDVMVSATGTITLNRAGSVVHVGYTYNSDGQCLRFEAGSATGTAQGKLQRSHRVIFRLYDTLGLQVGRDFDHLDPLTFRTTDMATDEAVPLFTGDKDDFIWDGEYSTENYVCWRFASPLPGTVVALMPQLVTQDRV
jgi:ubiquitin-activating enzyme E1-like protein